MALFALFTCSDGGSISLRGGLFQRKIIVKSRVYRAAKGGERACNYRTYSVNGEVQNHAQIILNIASIQCKAIVRMLLFLELLRILLYTTLHALSPLSAARYALGQM